MAKTLRESDFTFFDGGDGVEYEVWKHKATGELYRVPIERNDDDESEVDIERDFAMAEKI
jgi:hypothetical protein